MKKRDMIFIWLIFFVLYILGVLSYFEIINLDAQFIAKLFIWLGFIVLTGIVLIPILLFLFRNDKY